MSDTNEVIVVEESPAAEPKLARIKKFIPRTRTLLIAGGTVLALAAGAVLFALKRTDEEDFEDEQAKFDAEDASAA